MSFWKKVLGKEDLSPEEQERVLREKEEKRQRREAEYQAAQQLKNEKKLSEMQVMEKYFGKSTGFFTKLNLSLYKRTIQYFEEFIVNADEEVLVAIPAEYDKTKKREIKGMLIATNHRLVFVTNEIGHGELAETFEYHKMNGIALSPDGFNQKELLIDYGQSRKIFDDIVNDEQFKRFIQVVREKMHESKKRTATPRRSNAPSPKTDDKYEKLTQLAQLRDQGILTEEEFQNEKQKVLNS